MSKSSIIVCLNILILYLEFCFSLSGILLSMVKYSYVIARFPLSVYLRGILLKCGLWVTESPRYLINPD
jgi:hypothetical protein